MKKRILKWLGLEPVVAVYVNVELSECDIKIIVDSEKVHVGYEEEFLTEEEARKVEEAEKAEETKLGV